MEWGIIIVCVLAALLCLKFLKTIGKIIGTVILLVALCVFLYAGFDINVLEVVGLVK